MGALIRAATTHDHHALAELIERAYRGEAAKAGWTHEADLLAGTRLAPGELAAKLADPTLRVLVAVAEGAIVGCVEVAAKPDGRAYLGLLSVDPARQAAGLGRALIAAAEAAARTDFAASRIEMTVIGRRRPLIDWYVRRGYRETGERRAFSYPAETIGAVTLADLAFTVLEKPLVA